MTRLFHRLRIRALFNKKFNKYLLYAIGEILILIIGIVIALQVNNSNEERQRRVLEISILKTLKSDLEQDLEQWAADIEMHKSSLQSTPIVLDHLENKLPHSDSLNYHFLNSVKVSYFSFHSGALETLKSTGINIISNENLRKEIVDLYTYWFEFKSYLTDRVNDIYAFGHQNIIYTRFVQAYDYDGYGTDAEDDGTMVPLDYESLFNDDEYKFFLLSFRNVTVFYLKRLEESDRRVKALIEGIDAEIEELEST
jgi:hypothetical protein